ncbi:MAG: DUF5329 domain-containing protein [Gammaproteobacteria bacterium]|nr:DUF5329 domain-containing protein [Gammaproteobacteria bacterium]
MIRYKIKPLLICTLILSAASCVKEPPDASKAPETPPPPNQSVSHSGDSNDPEIEYLLDAIGASGCSFIRNNKTHDSRAARDHLNMKYGGAERYINSAEDFIERLATESSTSGIPYFIDCPGEAKQLSGQWLSERLTDFREQNKAEHGP